jgi:hypothetical protein
MGRWSDVRGYLLWGEYFARRSVLFKGLLHLSHVELCNRIRSTKPNFEGSSMAVWLRMAVNIGYRAPLATIEERRARTGYERRRAFLFFLGVRIFLFLVCLGSDRSGFLFAATEA